ncbi:hypothetical protein HB780_19475 [Rhizobium lusitanum]|uniref:hypothetical protein n=1 Tax=Rhizobium lusitanum TaxID=293958 RepID=UPI001622738D|nr:hypothetical protein [Rhizobium lusitanum]QND47843.1 hypothetical protein HB780_19475 [Rhizobium lusitanum]
MIRAGKPTEIIDGKTVKSLAEAHAIQGAVVVGQPGGWAVLVRYGTAERAVAAQRSHQPRLWRNLNTAVSFVREELGMPRFEIDTVDYDPEAIERKRPDQTERLRQQQEAAAYDTWFRAQVQEALDGIKDGTNRVVPDEEVKDRLDALRAELTRRAR